MRVALTDDELLWIRVRNEAAWPGILPTIDLHEEAAVRSAAARGFRSLLIRELLDEAGSLNEALTPVVEAGVSQDYVVLYASEETMEPSKGVAVNVHTKLAGGRLLERVEASGVHEMSVVDGDTFGSHLQDLLSTFVEDSRTVPTSVTAVRVVDGEPRHGVRIQGGSITAGAVRSAAAGVEPDGAWAMTSARRASELLGA